MNPLGAEQQELLLCAAFTQGDAALAAWHTWNAQMDWKDHFDADAYRIFTPLLRNLVAQGIEEPRLNTFRGIARKAWYNNHLLFHQVAPLLQELHAEGIETRLTYGAPLAVCYYTDYVLGTASEFGVWVPRDKARAAIARVQAAGWRAVSGIKSERLEGFLEARDACAFHGIGDNRIVLQWRLLNGCNDSDAPLWEGALPGQLEETPVVHLNPTDQLLVSLVQGSRIGESGFFPRAIDTMMLLEAAGDRVDWERFLRQVDAHNAMPVVAYILRRLKTLVNVPVPETVLATLESRSDAAAQRRAAELLEGEATFGKRAARLWSNYTARRCGGKGVSHAFGFTRYLQQRWQLAHWYEVPGHALKVAGSR